MTTRAYVPLVAAALIAALPTNHALADPSVTVVNPATNPAKTSSVDDPGRNPYQFFKNLQPCVHTTCQATTPPVPDGKRLVVQHVSAFGALTSPGNVVEVVVSTPTAVLSTFAPPVFGTTNQGFAFDQPVLGFADAGQTVTVFISTNGSFDQAASDFVVTGYLLDCSVNHCAAIAP
jgi:hypothetical protein